MGSLSSRTIHSPAQVMAATQFVKDAVAHDPIVIFSKSDCGYCQMAKEVKISLNIYLCNIMTEFILIKNFCF